MYPLLYSLRRSSSTNSYSTNAKIVIDYILAITQKYGINQTSEWAHPSPFHHFKVGMGEYSGNKAIQTFEHHVEVIDAKKAELAFFDRGTRVGVLKSYKPIEDKAEKEKIVVGLANLINTINADANPSSAPSKKNVP
jgi:hypothetical protein